MRNIIFSCFNKTDPIYSDYLTLYIEEAKNYEVNFKVQNILKDQEKKYFEYLLNSFDSSGAFPGKDLFEMVFPETKGGFAKTVEIPITDLRVYIFNVIDARLNDYVHDSISKLNQRVKDEGINQEISDEFSRLETLSNRNKVREVELDIDSKKEYELKKLRPTGLQTGIKEIDNRIGGMSEGTVTTIAGFTSQFKCVSEDERVLTDRGLLTMKEIYHIGVDSGLEVQSEFGMRKLVAVHDEGRKESYIVSIGGIPIETSPVHRFRVLTDRGLEWVEARNLKLGDKVVQSLKESFHKGEDGDPDFWRLYGQFCGDGYYDKNGGHGEILICCPYEKLVGMDTERLFSKFFSKYTVLKLKPAKEGYKEQYRIRASYSNALVSGFEDFVGKKARTKEFPVRLYYMNRKCWESFILGLYETDGSSGDNLGFTMSNKPFLLGVSRLLSAMGISSTLIYTGVKNDSYHLMVSGGRSKNRFSKIVESVNFKASNKKVFEEVKDISRYFPTRSEFLVYKKEKYTRRDYGVFRNFCCKDKKSNFSTIKRVCESYPEFLESDYFREILEAELNWNTVTNITQSECYMYDLTVEGSPTYLLNGYVTHNTTFALNIAHINAYYLGYNIAYISLETPKEDMNWNLLSCHSFIQDAPGFGKYNFVGHDKMRHCTMTPEEEDFIFNVVEPDLKNDYIGDDGKTHKRGKIVILDESDFNTFSFSEITSVLEKVDDELEGHLDAVIVDYVQLCKFSGSGYTADTNSQINAYVTFFRRLSQNFRKVVDASGKEDTKQLVMILLAQLNRGGWQKASRNNGKYDLTALADANELERGSYRIFTTYTTEEMKGRKSAQVQILKNRSGQTMYEPAVVYADGEAYVFADEDSQAGNTFGSGTFDGTASIDSAFSNIDFDDFGSLGGII